MKKVTLIEMTVRAYVVHDAEASHAPSDAVSELIKERLGRDIDRVDYRVVRLSESLVAGMKDEVALGHNGKTVKQVIEEG